MYRALMLSSGSDSPERPTTKITRACPSGSMTVRTAVTWRGLSASMRAASSSSRLFEGRAGEAADLFAKSGTESIDVEPGDLGRHDGRAFGCGELLIDGGLRHHRQQGEEHSKCAHALVESKE